MNSTGTSHRRPSRDGGQGSETRRPAAEASGWPGVRMTLRPLCVTVRPPASASSRTESWNIAARSSSPTITSLPTSTAGSGRLASAEITVNGGVACAAAGWRAKSATPARSGRASATIGRSLDGTKAPT